jgi:hypothetical protein
MVEVFMRKQVAFVSLIVILSAAMLAAQQQPSSVVNVSSNPQGCTVVLSGDMTVSGVTPTTFSQKLQGYYRITAYLDGYESYHSSVVLSGQPSTDIQLILTPKTRAKAGLRSLVVPGWGQMYYGAKTKGAVITIATAASAVVLGILHFDYTNKRDTYDEVHTRYLQTRDVSARESMLNELYQAQKDANDAENRRLVGAGVLAGIWAYNVIDAVLFFPDFGIRISGSELSLRPEVTSDGIKLVGALSF